MLALISLLPGPTLRVRVIFDGPDAYQMHVYGCNGRYSGYVEVRYDEVELERVGKALRNFPAEGLDSEVLWELKSWGATQPSSLRFFIHDRLGHASVELRLATGPLGLPDFANFVIELEVNRPGIPGDSIS
jgi:hypothetical protein